MENDKTFEDVNFWVNDLKELFDNEVEQDGLPSTYWFQLNLSCILRELKINNDYLDELFVEWETDKKKLKEKMDNWSLSSYEKYKDYEKINLYNLDEEDLLAVKLYKYNENYYLISCKTKMI